LQNDFRKVSESFRRTFNIGGAGGRRDLYNGMSSNGLRTTSGYTTASVASSALSTSTGGKSFTLASTTTASTHV